MKFTYEIGGKTYVQEPLVLGQWRQMLPYLQKVSLPDLPDTAALVSALADDIMPLVACCITEEGKSPRDKDIEALAAELEFACTPEQLLQIADDFFACNPLLSILEKLEAAAGRIRERMEKTGSTPSASSSPEAISPGGTQSSGAVY